MKKQKKLEDFFRSNKPAVSGNVITISSDEEDVSNKKQSFEKKPRNINAILCPKPASAFEKPATKNKPIGAGDEASRWRSAQNSFSCQSSRTLPVTDDPEPRTKKGGKCPFYKKVEGTTFAVDAFSYGQIEEVTAYFLSHFHYDHYRGLNKSFTGRLYCTAITARLVALKLKLAHESITVLPMDQESEVEGVRVKTLDANHCPGSAMFLFLLPDGRSMLHTGDFRASLQLVSSLTETLRRHSPPPVHTLYLDTTYLNPRYEFPSQAQVIGEALSIALDAVNRFGNRVLFVCGSYTIGKERLYLKLAEALGLQIAVDKPKFDILDCFQWESVTKYVIKDFKAASIHVRAMSDVKIEKLSAHLVKFPAFTHIVAFCPTGWNYSPGMSLSQLKPVSADNISIYNLPYSEHSSFSELKSFVQSVKPKKVITTVGTNYADMKGYIDSCLS